MRASLKALCGFILLTGSAALAQNALDASLHLGSGGVNTPNRQAPPRYIRRNFSETREYEERTGFNSESEYYRNYQRDYNNNNWMRNVNRNDLYPIQDSVSGDKWRKRDPLQFDSQGLALSSGSYRAVEDEGSALASYKTRSGDTGTLVASGVRGVKLERDRDRIGTERMSLYETAKLREDIRNDTMRADAIGVGMADPFKPYQPTDAVGAIKPLQSRPKSETQGAEPIDLRVKGYDAVVREVKQRFENKLNGVGGDEKPGDLETTQAKPKKDEAATQDRLSGAYERLKKEISEKQFEADMKAAGIAVKGSETPATKDAAKPATGENPDKAQKDDLKFSVEDYAAVLKHGQHIDTMTGEEKNRLNELLAEGQRSMYEGNSFVAEKRFEVALSIRPNDPVALAGLLHCQIGANLSGSAALSLHKLFVEHPEMMDVKWGPQTLPPRPLLEKALAEAGRRVTLGREASQYGLLQAYIGHLLDDQDAVTSGLRAVRGSPGDDKMAQILRKLWVDPANDKTPQRIEPPAAAPATTAPKTDAPETGAPETAPPSAPPNP